MKAILTLLNGTSNPVMNKISNIPSYYNYEHVIGFKDFINERDKFIGKEYFGDPDYDWKSLFNDKSDFTINEDSEGIADIVIQKKDYQELSYQEVLDKTEIITYNNENNTYTIWKILEGKYNGQEYYYFRCSNKLFENNDIINNIKRTFTLQNTHAKPEVQSLDFSEENELRLNTQNIALNKKFKALNYEEYITGERKINDMYLNRPFFYLFYKTSFQENTYTSRISYNIENYNLNPQTSSSFEIKFIPPINFRYNDSDIYNSWEILKKVFSAGADNSLLIEICLVPYWPFYYIPHTNASDFGGTSITDTTFAEEEIDIKTSENNTDYSFDSNTGIFTINTLRMDLLDSFNQIDLKLYELKQRYNSELHLIDENYINITFKIFGSQYKISIPNIDYRIAESDFNYLQLYFDIWNRSYQFVYIRMEKDTGNYEKTNLILAGAKITIPFQVAEQDLYRAQHQGNIAEKVVGDVLKGALIGATLLSGHPFLALTESVGLTSNVLNQSLDLVSRQGAPTLLEDGSELSLFYFLVNSYLVVQITRPQYDIENQLNNKYKMFGINTTYITDNIFKFGKKQDFQYFKTDSIIDNLDLKLSTQKKSIISSLFEKGITIWYYGINYSGVKDYENKENNWEI